MTRRIHIKEIDMRYAMHSLVLPLVLGLAACGQSGPSKAQQAQQAADALTGDAAGDAASNPQCKMFTLTEIATYLGAPAKLGTNAAMGTGCQWTGVTNDGAQFVMLQIVDARYHEPPSASVAGYKKLADVGTEGFVVPGIGGWQAGAIQRDKSINVVTSGATTSEAQTIAFLREALKRTGGR
jgi:predicted small lipoprotein YifL